MKYLLRPILLICETLILCFMWCLLLIINPIKWLWHFKLSWTWPGETTNWDNKSDIPLYRYLYIRWRYMWSKSFYLMLDSDYFQMGDILLGSDTQMIIIGYCKDSEFYDIPKDQQSQEYKVVVI